jgi:twitching motility protein PilI
VSSHRGLSVGLLVEEVTGLRHFVDEERTTVLASVDARIRAYLERAYWQEGEYWGVFSTRLVLEDPRFLQVAQ